MRKSRYLALMMWSRQTPRRAFFMETVCHTLPVVIALTYVVTAIWLLVIRADELVRFIAVPAATLALVSLVRCLYNRPRPYEKWKNAAPLLRSHRRGNSFPSRHAASAMVLALAGFTVSPLMGLFLLLLALGVGASRVAAGLHFVSDVLAGYLVALICGIFFWI